MRQYLIQKKDGLMILDVHALSNCLQKKSRIKLINYLADLIDDQFDGNASQNEIISICTATAELFPSLQDVDGGIVCIKLNYIFANLEFNSSFST